jgi:hypothetical protein
MCHIYQGDTRQNMHHASLCPYIPSDSSAMCMPTTSCPNVPYSIEIGSHMNNNILFTIACIDHSADRFNNPPIQNPSD